ncbi:hypothetical protein [Nocardiopsis deserti]|uniref:hypothetical protein n=1 Tax=Nocardiopsis deserti TaxID=2605988 RepID=UPI00123B3206|nr:hypothetical protein [Nocardiopsis deserti]
MRHRPPSTHTRNRVRERGRWPVRRKYLRATQTIAPFGLTWFAPLYYANAVDLLGLDENDAATYAHPAVRAEEYVQRQLMVQAPRTDAAMEAVAEAELVVATAERALHACYLYGNAHLTERRCLTCEVVYPCAAARLGPGRGALTVSAALELSMSLFMVWLNRDPAPPVYSRCSACGHVADPHGPAPGNRG